MATWDWSQGWISEPKMKFEDLTPDDQSSDDNSSNKNERAYAHKRRAERSDISSISAASAKGTPVKNRSLTSSAA